MRYLFGFILAAVLVSGCSQKKTEKKNTTSSQDSLLDISSFKNGNRLDSVSALLDFEVTDEEIEATKDSIDFIYSQLSARLAIRQKDSTYTTTASSFRDELALSKQLYDSLFTSNASLWGFSYYRATEMGEKERNLYYYFLKQHLFFLTSVLENAYWNYEFDKIK